MKKYLFLALIMSASSALFAAETLTFQTVLSKPVGSFWEVETTTCSYPDVAGTPAEGGAFSWQNQVVVNFGPTGQGGTFTLRGGPLKIGLLLMEDGSTIQHSPAGQTAFWMFPQDNPLTPINEGGVVTVYPQGLLSLKSLLVNNLILPKNRNTSIDVTNDLSIAWSSLQVPNLIVRNMNAGEGFQFVFTDTPPKVTANFNSLISIDGSTVEGYSKFLSSPNP